MTATNSNSTKWTADKLAASSYTDPREKGRGDNGVDLPEEDREMLKESWKEIADEE